MALRSWWSWLRRAPAPAIDAALALGLAVAVTVAIRVAPEQGAGRAPGAYTLGLTVAALGYLTTTSWARETAQRAAQLLTERDSESADRASNRAR